MNNEERTGTANEPGGVESADRVSIGRFARLAGLSIGALRHYDELDLLRPVEVDRFTGYRYYAADQVEIGRAIARLRDLEVPLEEIRAVLGTDDPAEQRRRVAGQAARVQARVDRQVRMTHASAYHWSRGGGTLVNAARSQWQIARVYATLGRGEPAVWHARRCVSLAEAATAAGVADDWDVAAALEALARAQAVSGDADNAGATQARARVALDAIADPEDRQLIEQDLNSIST